MVYIGIEKYVVGFFAGQIHYEIPEINTLDVPVPH